MKKFLKIIAIIFGVLIVIGLAFGEDTSAEEVPTPTALYPELEVVGLSDLKDITVTENHNMTIIRAKTNNRQEYDVHITLEDGKVIYVQMSAVMGDAVVMFDGEYKAIYDSEENTIKAYEK